jgi:hypothetical protein
MVIECWSFKLKSHGKYGIHCDIFKKANSKPTECTDLFFVTSRNKLKNTTAKSGRRVVLFFELKKVVSILQEHQDAEIRKND